MSPVAFAPAKINLFLHVGAPGADGFHPLCSLMAFADVGDRVVLHEADALSVRVHGPFAGMLAGEGDNLVLRAARALIARARGPQPLIGLSLEKLLPVAAGLGGGSSDAGAALRVLRTALGVQVDDVELEAIAASLGADGAACLWGRPVLAQGRGELLTPAPVLPTIEAVLVNPRVEVATPAVYKAFDAIGRFGDVEPPPLPPAFESVEELAAWLGMMRNDLEAPAVGLAPEIGDVLATLADERETLIARMSGSGATCFAICSSDIEADALAERVVAMRPGWWTVRCRLGGPWPES
ncbi:4-diphosphocytidyl-2C-methyl-D-erythritol kinase [Phenylobacterium sp. Root77]|uniref:4-(cytidine 5'-diphospho)-2-C-methyl-D-erythritol kinase n=1 Tax=unclassified Phenylobacterium TaxID=2640670 RepID=UPI0006F68D9E|nr:MULTISPECIES: 4-(cytidine 5'-diphospho)-2-C-methyl-D-erythritol kinase [unclassified Phenylobacterium]KQW71938.1 4-diphosphocytidyl-2C-methyl-D-erythritol kinase [Phenylobacterium sp. Root1277]KQW94859.1 4-diphosphocytidyl-2C-methyl-D-erythritol kinase [Phenylobacterium sp. Root1290]KRC44553.1 4-diphosphocytidyl-2C-methyl-D-erythritol kinase [Phenylobacterium sp. Root77]